MHAFTKNIAKSQLPKNQAPTLIVPRASSFSSPHFIVQRKPSCPCGGSCPRCKAPVSLQPKLRINEPNDRYEQEADRVAEQVMRMPEGEIVDISHGPAELRRKCAACAGGHELCPECEKDEVASLQRASNESAPDNSVPPIVHEVLRSPGQPLDAATRTFMEPRFGRDFSDVRVHTDAKAVESAKAVNALAYTVGRDMVFDAGEYAPNNRGGQLLLAHELTHIVQQNSVRRTDIIQRRRRRRIWEITRPKLSLYQANTTAANFFRGLASSKARNINALQFDQSPECPIRASFGPNPYHSGEEIIELIAKAYWCTGHQIREIHIFSHANFQVIAAEEGPVRSGLYSFPGLEERERGGRSIKDIPTEALASDAVFVLHGCQAGAGDTSFAELLLRSILGTSPRARVYGHSESGTCGRERDWREFSARFPEGRRVTRNPFHSRPTR